MTVKYAVEMLTLVTTFPIFPARSVAMPVTSWFGPALVTETGTGHTATPLRASEQEKVTVTGPEFQPPASGGGVIVLARAGGVLSMFTTTEALAVFPAKSVAVPVTV